MSRWSVTARTPGKIAVFFRKNEQTGCLREQNLQYGYACFAVLIKNTAIFPGVRAVTVEQFAGFVSLLFRIANFAMVRQVEQWMKQAGYCNLWRKNNGTLA